MKKSLTKVGPGERISGFVRDLHPSLFSFLETVTGSLNAEQAQVALVLETVQVERYVKNPELVGGRPPYSLKPSARAFVVKALLNLPTTKALVARLDADEVLRLLCGFGHKVPSEATFSRHFHILADTCVPDIVHENLVRQHVGTHIVHHLCRDASEIVGREKPRNKPKPEPAPRKKRGRPPKSEYRRVRPSVSRLTIQIEQDYRTSLKELPRACDTAAKINAKGQLTRWTGFKLHLDVADGGLPISAFTSSASLHDSQVAIPLSQMTSQRVGGVFYELMDRGYDADLIREAVQRQGHVPLIRSANRGNQEAQAFDAAQARRYKVRTTVERTFSDIKDNHGGRFIRVRGPVKVHAHLMYGVLAVFALVLLRA